MSRMAVRERRKDGWHSGSERQGRHMQRETERGNTKEKHRRKQSRYCGAFEHEAVLLGTFGAFLWVKCYLPLSLGTAFLRKQKRGFPT